MPGATTRRCWPIFEEKQRRRRAHFAAILRTDGQLWAISALRLVDDAPAGRGGSVMGLVTPPRAQIQGAASPAMPVRIV